MRLDGSVVPEKRFEIVKAFNSDPTIDVLLLTTHGMLFQFNKVLLLWDDIVSNFSELNPFWSFSWWAWVEPDLCWYTCIYGAWLEPNAWSSGKDLYFSLAYVHV